MTTIMDEETHANSAKVKDNETKFEEEETFQNSSTRKRKVNYQTKLETALTVLRSLDGAEQKKCAECVSILEEMLSSLKMVGNFNNEVNSEMLYNRLPKMIQKRVKEDGAIYFDARDTLISKLLGLEISKRVWIRFVGTLPRLAIFNSFLLLVSIISILGIFVIVSKEIFLISISITIAYLVLVFVVFLDFEIVKLIVIFDAKLILNLFLTFLYGWSVGVILDWDYRAVPMFLLTLTSTIQAGLTDAFEMYTRRAQVVLNILLYFLATLLLLFGFNLGWIPGTLGTETRILFTFTAFNKSIPYTAYAGLNTALLAILGLASEELWKRYLWRKTDRLRTLSIPLTGTNKFEFVDTSYLKPYMAPLEE